MGGHILEKSLLRFETDCQAGSLQVRDDIGLFAMGGMRYEETASVHNFDFGLGDELSLGAIRLLQS